MTSYDITFYGPDGREAATGSFISLSDEIASRSAARLLRNSDRFESVVLTLAGRVVASFNKADLAA